MGGRCARASDPSERYSTGSPTDSDPPIRPPSIPRKRAVPSQDKFKPIDDHAMKAPYSAAHSVKSLAEYLTRPAKNDMDKVRCFYRWITNNISYDAAGLRRKGNSEQQAEVVLRRRQGVCEGYSNLFLELCREADIPCKKIHGFSKSLGYIPEVGVTEDSRTNHAWNLVYVGGQWGAVDATWGAGRVTDAFTFERHYEELYFLTDPGDFVVKHLPYIDNDIGKSQGLQLLKKPLTLEEFNRSANPDTEGIAWGYRSTQKNHKLEVNEMYTVTFRTKKVTLQEASCKLKRKNTNSQMKQYILLRKAGKSRFTVTVVPPRTGTYELEIFGRPEGVAGRSLSRMISYAVQCQSVGNHIKPYPDHSGLWGIRENVDIEKYGFSSDLKGKDILESKNGMFEMKVKAKEKTKALFRLTNTDGRDLTKHCCGYVGKGFLTIKGYLPKEGYYNLALFGDTNGGGTDFDQIGDILIDCKSAHPDPQVYPLPGSLWGATQKAEDYGFTKQIHSKNVFITGSGEIDIPLSTTRDVVTSLKLESSRPDAGTLAKYAITFYTDKVLLIKVRLPKKGLYKLSLFAAHPSRPHAKELDHVAEFLIESKTDAKEIKTFPKPYTAAGKYSCVLIEPLDGVLPASQKVRLRLKSKMLKKLLINNERYEKKSGDVFEVTFTTPASGTLPVCGNDNADSKYDWLYVYEIK